MTARPRSSSRLSVAAFSSAAKSESIADTKPVIPETLGPAQQVSRVLPFQSYFSDTLLQQALQPQRRNDPIVATTAREEQIPGYSIGLHPSSQTPIALQFKIGGKFSSAAPLVLKPGQVARPLGSPRGVANTQFSGFVWGIPFGWLGGGLATLVVNPSSDADMAWAGNPEVIFHRQRMLIAAPAGVPTSAPLNWPTRFPWSQARSGALASPVLQTGDPLIAVEPTRVLMRLRLNTLVNPADMRLLFQGTNDFDLDAAGAVVASPVGFIDVTWGSFVSSGANMTVQYPYMDITGLPSRLAADDGGVQLVDLTGTLADNYVDVVRYGRL